MEDSLRACIRDICNAIADGSLDPEPPFQVKNWERGDDGNFRTSFRMHSTVDLRKLEGRESFQTCAEQARNDPIVGPQLNQLVGTSTSRVQLTLGQIVISLVGKMYTTDGRFEFDDGRFQKKWDVIFHDLSAETFDHVTIAPLPGFMAPFPVKISENIEIDRLTDEELSRCVRVGILGPIIPHFELISRKSAVGIRCTRSTEKGVGKVELASETGSFGRRGPADAVTTVEDVLTALHLFKQGHVRCPGEVSGVKAWLLDASYSFRFHSSRPPSLCSYELQDGEVDAFQKLWSDLTGGTLDERLFLAMALRRFNMAFGRQQLDDRIVDLMIAAEALFLHGTGAPSERGELRFRLAVRAAKFVAYPSYAPREVFDLMRKAYDIRSQVVHGGLINNTSLPDNPTATLPEFISAFEDVMRLSLQKTLVNRQVGQPGHWEDLLFCNPVEREPE